MNCKNCGTNLSSKFCPACGQKASVSVLTFHDILHEGWHNLTHTDKGYLQFFREMILQPGATIRNYLDGQRKRYFNPFTFYLVTTSLLILVTGWVFQREDKIYKLNNEFGQYAAKYLNYVLIGTLPILALLLWVLFRRTFRTKAEAFAVMVFAFGTLHFYLLLTNIFFWLFTGLHARYNDFALLAGYLFLFYILFRFLRPRSFLTILKLVLLTILFFLLVEVVGKGLLLYISGVPLKTLLGSFA